MWLVEYVPFFLGVHIPTQSFLFTNNITSVDKFSDDLQSVGEQESFFSDDEV